MCIDVIIDLVNPRQIVIDWSNDAKHVSYKMCLFSHIVLVDKWGWIEVDKYWSDKDMYK